jgi:hypothetical protein
LTPPADSALVLRRYQPGAESELVELWNRTHALYGGHVPRTVDYWRWCILARPGVEADDVIILAADEEAAPVVAYGVLGPGAAVLELAIDDGLVGEEREAVAARLVEALEDRCRVRGDEAIAMELPGNDGPLGRAMVAAGYRPEATGSRQLVIVDLALLLEELLAHRAPRLPHGWSPSFRVEIEPGAYHFCPQRRLLVRVGPPAQVTVLEGEGAAGGDPAAASADCRLRTDISTLTDLIFNRVEVEAVLAGSDLTVEPAERAQDVRTLLNLLVVKSSWYTPNADGR